MPGIRHISPWNRGITPFRKPALVFNLNLEYINIVGKIFKSEFGQDTE